MIPDDVLVAHALAMAVAAIEREPGVEFGERRHLQPAVIEALAVAFGAEVVRGEGTPADGFPDWAPQPRGLDVLVTHGNPVPRIGIELKVDAVDEAMWDILKMASLRRLPSTEAAYVAVAAKKQTWSDGGDCVRLFTVDPDEEKEWYTAYFFEEFAKAWASLLRGGPGRPTRVPERLHLPLVAVLEVSAFPDYELRVLRVENTSHAPWLLLDEGWPVGRDPAYPAWYPRQIKDCELRPEDLPAVDADEDEYYRFALTTNGYERTGSLPDCGALGNEAREAWREDGSLPDTIRALRSCLFFEQRRSHFQGEEWNERTSRYVRDIVEAIRGRLPSPPSTYEKLSGAACR